MFYYRPSSRSQDYTPYLPRCSYRPASFDLNDVPSSALPFEDFGYSPLPHPFLPPRVDAETRYRRALDELQAAEQEFEAQMALERARQAAAVRQRAAAEAARFRRVDALYAEIERIKRGRALQVQAEELRAQRERALRPPTPFDRAHRGGRALLRALVNDGAEGAAAEAAFVPAQCGGDGFLRALIGDGAEGVSAQGGVDRADRGGRALLRALIHDQDEGVSLARLFEGRPTCYQPTSSPTRHDNGALTLGDLLGLLQGPPEPELGNRPQEPTSSTPSEVQQRAEPEAESGWVKEHDGEANLRNLVELFHDISAQVGTAFEVRLSIWGVWIQSSNMMYTAAHTIPT